MKISRTWIALGTSLTIHIALVLALGISLMQSGRVINRVEVNLEGAAIPSMPPGVQAPSPVAGPEMPRPASMPAAASVAPRLAMSAPSSTVPMSTSFDDDGALPLQVAGGVPGPTSVPLHAARGGGGGSGGAGAGSGPGVAGGGQGSRGAGPSTALAGYLNAIRARVDAAKRYPQMAQQRRQEGVVVVTFRLSFDGRLLDEPVVTRSSGFRQLDSAALLAVRRGAPYPSFPLDPKDMKALEIPVKFYLR